MVVYAVVFLVVVIVQILVSWKTTVVTLKIPSFSLFHTHTSTSTCLVLSKLFFYDAFGAVLNCIVLYCMGFIVLVAPR